MPALVQPVRRTLEEILPGLTEAAPSQADLAALTPGARMAALALSVSGLGADAGREDLRTLYRAVICPERDNFLHLPIYRNVTDWYVVYSCGHVGRSLLRRFGARAPEIGLDANNRQVPYVAQMAVNNIMVVAQRLGAWKTSGLPPQGAICIIGTGTKTHVRTVTETIGDDMISTSVDGGQTIGSIQIGDAAKPLEGILTIRSIVSPHGRSYAFGDRVILGYVDPDLLAAATSAPATIDLI
jgi:hypothetical protein